MTDCGDPDRWPRASITRGARPPPQHTAPFSRAAHRGCYWRLLPQTVLALPIDEVLSPVSSGIFRLL